MTSATTGPGASFPRPRPYAFPSMQAAAQIDPASVEVPVSAINVHGPLVPGLDRLPLRREFLHTLERVLVAGEQVRSWPWGTPSARYYSPEAVVALLAAERVEGWTARVAHQFRVPPDELLGPLLARQRSWYAERQLDQLLGAEQRALDRLHGDPYWAALRHLRRGPDGAYFRHFLDATGTAAERRQVAEVVAAHDGHWLWWSWHLDPDARERMRGWVQDLDLKGLRVRVAEAARLLRARPPDPSVTLANAWAVKELLLAEAGRVRARIERYRLDARALPARRLRARRLLQLQVEVEQAALRGLAQRLDQIGDVQDRLDRLRTTRRAWESQPDHVEVLAWGELSAERLRLLEFGALLRVEAEAPPYLRSTIGPPFPAKQPVGRRAWLQAAWTVERFRADQGVSDPDVAIGLEPSDASAHHLYDLAHQTLTALGRDLARLRAASRLANELVVDLAE